MVRTNEPVRAARLPQRGSGSPGADRLKGFVALLAILAIVGGVPYVLLRFFGTPWPDTMPSSSMLFSELSIETVLGIIAFFIWVAWLHFVICLIAEAVAEIRGHGLSPRIPFGGGSQTVARRLIGTVVLIAAGAGVSLPVASAVTTSVATPTSVTVTQGGEQGSTAQFRQTEARSTVLSGNQAKTTTHTGVRTNHDHNGQVIKYTEVRPPQGRNYDCLWDIAERYLGEGRRYKEIYDLNKNKLQPDGRRLTNPDLILPGWQVRLPGDAKGPGVHTVRVNIEDHSNTKLPTGSKVHHGHQDDDRVQDHHRQQGDHRLGDEDDARARAAAGPSKAPSPVRRSPSGTRRTTRARRTSSRGSPASRSARTVLVRRSPSRATRPPVALRCPRQRRSRRTTGSA